MLSVLHQPCCFKGSVRRRPLNVANQKGSRACVAGCNFAILHDVGVNLLGGIMKEAGLQRKCPELSEIAFCA